MPAKRSFDLRSFAALCFVACACVSCPHPEGGSATPPRIKVDRARIPGTHDQRTYFSIRATTPSGRGFVRPPYDLWGNFVIEATYGIYDLALYDATAGASVVLELDARGPSPPEFYGIGAQVLAVPQRGLNVYVQSHLNGNQGQIFFPGAERAEVRIESNGSALTFSARAADTGNFQQVAVVGLSTPAAPLNPGMGFLGLDTTGELGFEFLRVPTNGSPPTPQGAQYDALQRYYDALFDLQAGAQELNGPAPYPLLADDDITAAIAHLGECRSLIASLALTAPGEGGGVAVEDALRVVDKVVRTAQKLRAKVQQSHSSNAAKGVRQAIAKKLYKPSYELTDLIITSELRASLPSGGL